MSKDGTCSIQLYDITLYDYKMLIQYRTRLNYHLIQSSTLGELVLSVPYNIKDVKRIQQY